MDNNTNTKFYQINKNNTTDVWLTPPNLIQALGRFDLDPCCPNNLPWKTADKHYSLELGQDGLKLPWVGRVWLNPPYSAWVPWIEKLKNHGNGIALIFARTETKGFFDYVWNDADAIKFVKSRIKFYKSDLKKGNSATAPSVLIAYGEENAKMLKNSCIEGKFISLKIDKK